MTRIIKNRKSDLSCICRFRRENLKFDSADLSNHEHIKNQIVKFTSKVLVF